MDDPDSARLAGLTEAARALAPGGREGLLGPRSESWRILRELALLFAGGRALLLQIAHPAVAAAVEQHSDFRSDPLGRGRRTFEAVYQVCFGDLEEALAAAKRVHLRHGRVLGTVPERGREQPYRANDPQLLLWVHATLVDTAMVAYDRFVGPLDEVARTRYYDESRRIGMVFGVDEDLLPPDLPSFRLWFDRLVDGPTLAPGRSAIEQAEVLLGAPPSYALAGFLDRAADGFSALDHPVLRIPLRRLTRIVTAGLLPDRLRAAFGLPFGLLERSVFIATTRAVAAGYRLLPTEIRHHPAYRAALTRTAPR